MWLHARGVRARKSFRLVARRFRGGCTSTRALCPVHPGFAVYMGGSSSRESRATTTEPLDLDGLITAIAAEAGATAPTDLTPIEERTASGRREFLFAADFKHVIVTASGPQATPMTRFVGESRVGGVRVFRSVVADGATACTVRCEVLSFPARDLVVKKVKGKAPYVASRARGGGGVEGAGPHSGGEDWSQRSCPRGHPLRTAPHRVRRRVELVKSAIKAINLVQERLDHTTAAFSVTFEQEVKDFVGTRSASRPRAFSARLLPAQTSSFGPAAQSSWMGCRRWG